MNGIQRKKAQNTDKEFPGCLGRMVNLFDLGNGVAANKLLTDKPHCDGSSISRSQSDVTRVLSAPFGDQIEDKMIVPELRRCSSNNKTNHTPMKMLIDQEMSKEVESKHNPPNVVAKLMGLDTLPHQQTHPATQRSHSRGYSRRSLSHSGILVECWEKDHSFLEKQIPCDGYQCQEQKQYKDVYEIWQQSQKPNMRVSQQKGEHNENAGERKMAMVRQKFIDAKRLSTDEKGRQSKEFQDALEFFSSNKDLFLKFLQEPNSLFSHHLHDVQSMPPSPETKRITVLRPSKAVDNEKIAVKKNDKPTKKPVHMGQVGGWDKCNSGYSPTCPNQRVDEYPGQPTRIVVLKPSPRKALDIKVVVSPPCSSPRLPSDDFYDEPEDDEAQESRQVAQEISQQMRDKLVGHRRDETLLSSVNSNGYIGDDSSFNKSEIDDVVGNISDSEIMSPTSRHSWDYINRFGSPDSSSPFSRASCSPESSVCREAKKRLSERWAMMASNGRSQEQRAARRSSSTLGEMLALSDTKKSLISEEGATSKEQEARGSTSCLTSNVSKEEYALDSPKSLPRSKSLPVSSTVYGARLNVEVSEPEASKVEVAKDLTKAKSMKSSFRGKVSSLFFSKNKKSSKEKYDESQSVTPETPGSPIPAKSVDDATHCTNNSSREECSSPVICGFQCKTTYADLLGGTKEGIISNEGRLTVAKPAMAGNTTENQGQPSPISVLEPPFEEDDNTTIESCGSIKRESYGSGVPFKSNLIDKSPPIGSIARTLSWDDSCAETSTPYSVKPLLTPSRVEEEEHDWLSFVQKLLLEAGLDGKVQSDTVFTRWHSPESPLDPSLRDKYATLNDKELLHEAKRRQRRSNRKLVFDCVNAVLKEITSHVSDISTKGVSCDRACHVTGLRARDRFMEGGEATLVDHVWGQLKEWFFSEMNCTFGDGGDSNSLVVEMVVRKEVVGNGWVDGMRVELDNLGKEIEGKLLEELVEEAVGELTAKV